MKFMIVLACALAVASAGYVAAPYAYAAHHYGYYPGAQHLPVIGPNGVPIDTPEVQHARAAHLAHKVEAHARNGDVAVVAHHAPLAYAHHYGHHYAAPVVAAHHVGIAETPEVVAAKTAHFAAHAEVLARDGHYVHHLHKRGIVGAPFAHTAYTSPLAYSAAAYHPYGYSAAYGVHPYSYAASPYSAYGYGHYY